ncbi:MAG: site-specific integrase [Hyphomicrobium sp.]|nr:site-specific integrase [Hyphomicrobium sp.]
MASITKLPSGRWRAQLRRRQKSVSKTFRLRADAERWATEQQDRLSRGEGINKRLPDSVGTLGDMIDLHLTDMAEVGKEARRSKEATLLRLKDTIGTIRLPNLTRERIIEFGRDRAKEGAGPATLAIDLSFINTVLKHASAIYGYSVPTEQVRLGRNALVILGLVGKSTERDRRPTEKELSRILAFFRTNRAVLIPMERVIKFAVATAMRQDEITRILCDDFDLQGPSVLIRQRKHPREKKTNNQIIPLVADTGFNAVALIKEQLGIVSKKGTIFPYNPRSIGTAFRRACIELQIDDLHFHDLRHEGISRLFEADWDIPQVAAVSGHKDWKMLQRYTHLRPSFIASRAGRVVVPRVA